MTIDLIDTIIVNLFKEWQARGHKRPKGAIIAHATGMNATAAYRRVQYLIATGAVRIPRSPRPPRAAPDPAEQLRHKLGRQRRAAVAARRKRITSRDTGDASERPV